MLRKMEAICRWHDCLLRIKSNSTKKTKEHVENGPEQLKEFRECKVSIQKEMTELLLLYQLQENKNLNSSLSLLPLGRHTLIICTLQDLCWGFIPSYCTAVGWRPIEIW